MITNGEHLARFITIGCDIALNDRENRTRHSTFLEIPPIRADLKKMYEGYT